MAVNEFILEYFSILSQMITLLISICVFFIPVFTVTVLLLRYWIRHRSKYLLPHLKEGDRTLVIGFFHPYCNAGGGGERVLWTAIRAIQKKHSHVKCLVYTGDLNVSATEILETASQRFNIFISKPVEFVFLKRRRWVEAKKYPIFTLLGQSFGSLLLGFEALLAYVPDVYIDSMGYAFTIPLFKYFGGCKVGCYVHYPTISTDMLERVTQRTQTYNNASFISRSPLLSGVKLLYYKMFAYCYGLAGKRSDVIMVNSSWTYGHIKMLWQTGDRTCIVYPPCDTTEFLKIPLSKDTQKLNIISVAQFRPEKDHTLQVRSFYQFLQGKSVQERDRFTLLLVGSCRDAEDSARVDTLRDLCEELKIRDNVEFKLNVRFEELKQLLSKSVIGLHSMWNEHFGIGVVEMMAAGTIVLAHNSGGPKLDIVVPYNDAITGFLADDVASYSEAMETIFSLPLAKKLEICQNARQSVMRFTEEEFEHGFLGILEPLMEREELPDEKTTKGRSL